LGKESAHQTTSRGNWGKQPGGVQERGREKEIKSMTMLAIFVSMVGAVLVVAAVEYIRRSRKTREPIQLGIDKKLRP